MDSKLPESPISVNFKIKSPNGFEHQITLRKGITAEDFSEVMSLIAEKEKTLLAKGYTPLPQNSFGKKSAAPVEYIEGRKCPEDGGRLIKPAAGSKAPIKCENNKYSFQTKQSYGCPFKYWPDQTQPIRERQVNEEAEYGGHEGDGGGWPGGA